jgi:hypothetical protein
VSSGQTPTAHELAATTAEALAALLAERKEVAAPGRVEIGSLDLRAAGSDALPAQLARAIAEALR